MSPSWIYPRPQDAVFRGLKRRDLLLDRNRG